MCTESTLQPHREYLLTDYRCIHFIRTPTVFFLIYEFITVAFIVNAVLHVWVLLER